MVFLDENLMRKPEERLPCEYFGGNALHHPYAMVLQNLETLKVLFCLDPFSLFLYFDHALIFFILIML